MLFPSFSLVVGLRNAVFLTSHQTASRRQATTPSAESARQTQEFEVFFRGYERQITAYLCRMLGEEQTAKDFCQETFIRAWQHFPRLQEQTAARAWLYRVATNLALRHLEWHKTHNLLPLDDDVLPGASDPGRRVVESDLVQQTLLTLSPHQRSILILHEVHGLPCEDIGKILHMSKDAVKMALWRGREQFRVHYLHEEHQP